MLVTPRNPQRLAKLIPTAKLVTYKGQTRVAVPHRLDETRVLCNLGLDVPSPILQSYDWPRSRQIKNPFEAQKLTASFCTLNTRSFVLNDLGTGKTLSCLWAFDYLKKQGKAKKLLISCPLSTMERAWADELFLNFPHLTYTILYGHNKKRRLENLENDVDVYIINHHGVKVITEELCASGIDSMIIDEVSQCCRNKTDIWKAHNEVANGHNPMNIVWGLTGTPIPNEPTDAYYQVKLINPHKTKMYFTAFKRSVMAQFGPFTWIPKADAMDIVDALMSPAIRFRRDQCVDLPPTIYTTREAPLSDKQQKAYDTMHKQLFAEIESGEVTAVNEAVKASKLIQITCGVLYDEDGKELSIGAPSRVKECLTLIAQSTSKTIVFVPFKSALSMLAKEIEQAGYKVGVIHGGVAKAERDTIFKGFQSSHQPEVIVAQPASMSHGLTLTAASTIVWFAPLPNNEVYEQANGRITRPGQKHTTVIAHIEATAEERRIYHRLKTKQKMQNILLEKKVAEVA